MAKAKPKKKAAKKPAKKTAKKAATKTVKKSARGASETALRSKVGRIDEQIVQAMAERAQLVQQIGRINRDQGHPERIWGREEETLGRVTQLNGGPLSANCVRATFREIVSGCRALVTSCRVAFLGPLHSYSHLAAIHRFGQSVELAPVGSIAAVFEEVKNGQSHFGLVPIENSTDGRITDTLEMFTRLSVRICGEVELEIHHNLLGKCARTEVQEVYSKPQAISQCRNWLAKHLPTARTIEVTSTSAAAQLAKEKPGVAAIASHEAGMHFGLDVLADRIEDNRGNTTRFAVIGEHSADRTGRDKTAVMFQVEHQPGSLADAMNIFKRNRLNLTWIESFPIPESQWSYLFFVELEGHETDSRVKRAVAALEKRSLRLEILGSFAAEARAEV